MPPKAPRKTDSAVRVNSANAKQYEASLLAQAKKIQVWPEWSDVDINAEKWDAVHKGKEKEKGKSPVVTHFFDDPDGKIELPSSLRVTHWKRPQDFIVDKAPTIVDLEEKQNTIDLCIPQNECAFESELIRHIVSEIMALWAMQETKVPVEPGSEAQINGLTEETVHMWKPWEHIYAINKVGKGPNIPAYNPHGKYALKLWWMGCWRKIIVDDLLPFNEEDKLLLPMTSLGYEIWPMILCKGIIKIAALDYNGGNLSSEFGEFSAVHCLTGWMPEVIPLQSGHYDEIWSLLRQVTSNFKLPELAPEKPAESDAAKAESAAPESLAVDEAAEQQAKEKEKAARSEKGEKTVKTAKDKGSKDAKGDKKDKDKDKDKHKEAKVPDELPIPEKPEFAVFASFSHPTRFPPRACELEEMANASEQFRKNNISHMYPHPVWVRQSRDCPLERPPPPTPVPAWKLIRPRKKKDPVTDEPRTSAPESTKPIRCLQITSPFVGYKVSRLSVQLTGPRSKERGSSVSQLGGAISEGDEGTAAQFDTPRFGAGSGHAAHDQNPASGGKADATADSKPQSGKGAPGSAAAKGKAKPQLTKKEEPAPAVQPSGPSSNSKKGGKQDGGGVTPAQQAAGVATAAPKDQKKGRDVRVDSAKTTKSERNSKAQDQGLAGQHEADSSVTVRTGSDEQNEQGDAAATTAGVAAAASDAEYLFGKKDEPKEMWMDFDLFAQCFKNLYIYHKPHTYPHKATQLDMKGAVQNPAAVKLDKRSGAQHQILYSDQAPSFLFVDSLKPIEVVACFTSFSRWPDTSPQQTAVPPGVQSHASVRAKDSRQPEKESPKDGLGDNSGSNATEPWAASAEKEKIPVQPGTLLAEPYSWKNIAISQPILRIKTTATRSAVLVLPAGRHVLRFNMSAPLGYFLHLCSTIPFVFGDEETVMPHLTKESCRFIDNCTQVISLLGKCIGTFNNNAAFKESWEEFTNCHCPYKNDKSMSKQHHFKIFNEAFYTTIRKALPAELLSPEMAFAFRALMFDATTPNILGLAVGSRPATGASGAHRGSAKKPEKDKKNTREVESKALPDKWADHEPTPEEHVAQVKIGKCWRGYYVRKIVKGRMPGTDVQAKALESLTKAWAAIEGNAEQMGLNLFRHLFKTDPEIMPKYPFYQDEWNKISYADYTGNFADQPAGAWFVVFREVFYVQDEALCVPKLYVPLSTCLLRVVDNDTGIEIPRIFQKVAPYVYRKNKKGYTFVAEARSVDAPVTGGKWKMRLISSMMQLPLPVRNEVNSAFHSREIRDYYVPSEKGVMLRYSVKVLEDNHLVSLQLSTSRPDVYIKIQVLDHEEELVSASGKGHVVLPSFIFLKDHTGADETEKRPGSRGSLKGGSKSKSTKRSGSAGPSSRPPSRTSAGDANDAPDDEESVRPHKYVIQAVVMRSSWPLTPSQWAFVQELREQEKNEMRLIKPKEREPSPSSQASKDQKAANSNAAKPKAAAKGGAKGDKQAGAAATAPKEKTSRPPSVMFDAVKPHWILRIVSDASNQDDVEIKKDAERYNEIKALKRAWEEAEPGRAAKAMQSRLRYLATHIVKTSEGATDSEQQTALVAAENEAAVAAADQTLAAAELMDSGGMSALMLEPPPAPKPKEALVPLDLSPFLRNIADKPRFLDSTEMERQAEMRQREFQKYRQFRDSVERWREEDRHERNRTKVQQLDKFERMQATLDEKRAEVNKPREAIRQQYLEAERKHLEELAAAEAALKAEQEKSLPSPKGRRSAKKSPKGAPAPPPAKSGKKK